MSDGNRVFVVDDDASARKGLTRLLRAAGYEVRPFASGEKLLAALEPDEYGCLVLDARMSEMSDDELQERLAEHHVQCPVIFVTADDNPETRKKAQKMKAVAFFRKPVDGTALLDTVAWALDSANRALGSQ